MALVEIPAGLLNSPDTMDALYRTFSKVEVVSEDVHLGTKTFRVLGQGTPTSDVLIQIEFVIKNDQVQIRSWERK
jgi:hypothetical protein